ncbi:guanine deaminase [Fructilactobacillus frigidiflavus]|uniref:guanine deaminase n=1 Tax=Fructilactobacillus frigidiflavus TaxID=3242688 RepID=UPI0037571996
MKLVIKGSGYTSTSKTEIEFLKDVLIEVNDNGKIFRILHESDRDYEFVLQNAKETDKIVELTKNQYFLPGFIDTHIHAPQWPNAGLALDKPLNEWLNEYTFPLEAKYQDLTFSKKVYDDLTKNLVDFGTTTAVYFGTIYPESNLVLAKMCNKNHQRGLIGQVAMDDQEMNPKYYRDSSAEDSIEKTKQFIEELNQQNETNLIKQTTVITPRFLPSCSLEALRGLAKLANQYHLPIQSHCSESDWENGYALEKYGKRDATVLAECGLMTNRSIMAHGTLLNDDDLDLFENNDVTVSHCPISNVYFGDGILPVKKILQHEVNVGLGTDISGGFSPSMYDNVKQSILSSQQLQSGVDTRLSTRRRGVPGSRITAKTAFYLATVGGAKAINLPTGEIKPGYLADLQIVENQPKPFQPNTSDDIFENLMYATTKNDIKAVYVEGIKAK